MARASLLLMALLLGPLAFPAAAADPLVGPIYLDDVVVVAPNATLELGPGAVVTGPGHFEVWGSLLVLGDPARRAEVSVPILLVGNGTSRFEHARFWGVHGAAVTLAHGALVAHDIAIETDGSGIDASNDSRLVLTDSTLRANAGPAVALSGNASASLSRDLVEANARGIVVRSTPSLLVEDSTLRGDAPLLDIAWDGGAFNVSFARNDLAALHPTGGPLVAVRVGANGSAAPLAFSGNRLHDAAVGVLLGPGPAFESRNDTLDANGVGLSIRGGAARLVGTALGNDRDIEGSDTGALSLDNVTYLRAAMATIRQPTPSTFPWAGVGFGVVALALVGLLVAQPLARARRRRAPSPAASPPPGAPVREPPTLTPQEHRILADIVANPDHAQATIAARLGMTRQALHYHVKKLEARGLVVKTVQGRETRCRVPPEVAAVLRDVPEGTQTRSDEKA